MAKKQKKLKSRNHSVIKSKACFAKTKSIIHRNAVTQINSKRFINLFCPFSGKDHVWYQFFVLVPDVHSGEKMNHIQRR